MLARVLTAVVGVPLTMLALFQLPRTGFVAVVMCLCLIAAFELARIGRAAGAGRAMVLLPGFVLIGALLLLGPGAVEFGGLNAGSPTLLLALLVVAGAPLAALWAGGTMRERALAANFLGFGALYLALPVAAFDQLRGRDPWLVVLLLATVWLTDAGAFLCGTRWGRHKLAPLVSPNKSWEGFWGGLILGLFAAAVCSWWRLGSLEPTWLAAGLAVSVVGQMGDLLESMFKRSAGVKDSGNLLPGHGGMLDRLDSLILAAPVLELIWRVLHPAAS